MSVVGKVRFGWLFTFTDDPHSRPETMMDARPDRTTSASSGAVTYGRRCLTELREERRCLAEHRVLGSESTMVCGSYAAPVDALGALL